MPSVVQVFSMAAEVYYGTYPVVEVQQTFYRPPQLTTLGRWRREAPPAFEFTLEVARMRALLGRIDRSGLVLLWEPRGAWPPSLVGELCRDLDLVHAVDPFVTETVTPEAVYYRLHGIGGSRHSYTSEELAGLAARLPASGRPYVLFNNLPRVGDSARFLERLRAC